MALALAWSRSLSDAHEVEGEGSTVTGASGNGFTPFVLCEEDEYMSLADATEAGQAALSPDRAVSGEVRSEASTSPLRPVWSEAELDKHLDKIKVQLQDQSRPEKSNKINLQGTQLWQPARSARLVESLQQTTEALVWGERHDASLFDLFCEHRMLAVFVTALRTLMPMQVKVQILQTISILVQNARRTTSFFFLLSGGQLNMLFDDPPDLDEEEILTYFVTFLKSLAMRLDPASARLCLAASVDPGGRKQVATEGYVSSEDKGQNLQRLPIFECAVQLVGHRDSMVQTAARTALLSLLKIDDPLVQGAASAAALHQLAPSLANILSAAHFAVQLEEPESTRLQDAIEDLEDWLGFIGDLVALGHPGVNDALRLHKLIVDGQDCSVLSGEALGRRLSMTTTEARAGGEDSPRPEIAGVISAAAASSRLEVVLKHYNKKDGLPFPCNLCCHQNVAVALTRVACSLVAKWEIRRAIVCAFLTIFRPEELCVDLGNKAGTDALLQLERRLAAALQASSHNSTALNVLRSVAKSWHEICKQAVASSPKRPASPPPAFFQEEVAIRGLERVQGPRSKRYHVYTYTILGESPYEKLATDSLKKATTSLHYNTLVGRIAVLYDQSTGRSTFKRDKRGNSYILKAIHMAHREYPCATPEDGVMLENARV